jgi:putative two-component system response regulator
MNERSSTMAQILVVDDEAIVRDLLCRWIEREGYACVQAAEVNAAWQLIERHDIQLVVTDIMMPGPSGIEFLQRIRHDYPEIAVIVLTGVSEAHTAIRALIEGAASYLIKPVNRDEFLFQFRRALEIRGLRIQRREYLDQLEERVREQTRELRDAHEETIHRLVTASRFRDDETGSHIKRVGIFSELLAQAIAWPASESERIRLAAPMHDVGKIGIPDGILQKHGLLTPEEFEIMKTHTTIGAEILSGSSSPMLQMAHTIALCHHERWDGAGYPAGLAGAAIPEPARLVAIVDVFDALTHDRVYRPAMPEDRVLSIIERGHGTHFDPNLLEAFMRIQPELPQIARDNPDGPAHVARRKLPLRPPIRAESTPQHTFMFQDG